MAQESDTALVRLGDGSYRLDRTSTTPPSPIAQIRPIRDHAGKIEGWRLKPFVTVRGATSRKWESVAAALTATKLFTPGRAKATVSAADAQAVQKSQSGNAADLR